MTTALKTLPIAAILLAMASGCELLDFNAPGIEPPPDDTVRADGAAPTGPQPLYPLRPGNKWQYKVTALDGSQSTKWVMIDQKPLMVGGTGPHQIDMAYAVRTTFEGGGSSSIVTMQQAVGDQIVNWRRSTYDRQAALLVDVNWEPEQLELDQSSARTHAGVSWLENYTEVKRPSGGVPTTVRQSETWTVMGEEVLALPGIMVPFQTIVFQKKASTGGGNGDAGTGTLDAGDAGKTSDAGVRPPMFTGQTFSEAVDAGGNNAPKTLWYARSYGKVKEAGGGEPTEELTGFEPH